MYTTETEIWVAVVVAMAGSIGTLVLMGVRDVQRRIGKLESSDERLTAAMLTFLLSKDPEAVAKSMLSLLTNGTGKGVK